MKKLFFLLIVLNSCSDPVPYNSPKGNTTLHETPLRYFTNFKIGSYYIFENKRTGDIDSLYVRNYLETSFQNRCTGQGVTPTAIKYILESTFNSDLYALYLTHSTDCKDEYNYFEIGRTSSGLGGDILYSLDSNFYSSDIHVENIPNLTTKYYTFKNVLFARGNFQIWFAKDIGICQYVINSELWVLKKFHINK